MRIWHQDIRTRPIDAINAKENPQLAQIGTEPFTYVFPFTVPAIDNNPFIVEKVYQVPFSNQFWITNFGAMTWDTTNQQPTYNTGELTVIDSSTENAMINEFPLIMLTDSVGRPSSLSFNLAQYFRTELPCGYGIGAGGSFKVRVELLTGNGPSTPLLSYVLIEGFKDFAFKTDTQVGDNGQG